MRATMCGNRALRQTLVTTFQAARQKDRHLFPGQRRHRLCERFDDPLS